MCKRMERFSERQRPHGTKVFFQLVSVKQTVIQPGKVQTFIESEDVKHSGRQLHLPLWIPLLSEASYNPRPNIIPLWYLPLSVLPRDHYCFSFLPPRRYFSLEALQDSPLSE